MEGLTGVWLWAVVAVLLLVGPPAALWRRAHARAQARWEQLEAATGRSAAQVAAAITAAHGYDARLTALAAAQAAGEQGTSQVAAHVLELEAQSELRHNVTTAALARLVNEQAALRTEVDSRATDLQGLQVRVGVLETEAIRVEAHLAGADAQRTSVGEDLRALAAAVAAADQGAATHVHPAHSHEVTWPEHTHATSEHWHTEGQQLAAQVAAFEERVNRLVAAGGDVAAGPVGSAGSPTWGATPLPALTTSAPTLVLPPPPPLPHPADHDPEYLQVSGTWEDGQLHVMHHWRHCGHLVREVAPPPLVD